MTGRGDLVTVRHDGDGRAVVVAHGGYAFEYLTPDGLQPNWSRASAQPLTGVAIFAAGSGSLPAAFVRMREQQDFHCEYDVLIASCRTASP